MSDPMSAIPEAITSSYLNYGVDQEIALYSGQVNYERDGKTGVAEGKFWFAWTPHPSIKFSLQENILKSFINMGEIKLTIPNSTKEFKGQITSVGTLPRGNLVRVEGVANPVKPRDQKTDIAKIIFSLPNMPWVFGKPVKHGDGFTTNGRLVLQSSIWKITLDPVSSINERTALLRQTSGYAITYVGCLEKLDKSEFSEETAEDLLSCLECLLSFAIGQWTSAMFFEAYDSTGSKIKEDWLYSRITRYQDHVTWFDVVNSSSLSAVFPRFLDLWQNSVWGENFFRAIYWFVEANRNATAVQTSIITTQAALELLVWVYYIEDRKILTGEGFDKLIPSDRIRLAMSNLKLNPMIPDHFTELKALATSLQCKDGPHVLTEIRNNLIHPARINKRRSVTQSQTSSIIQAEELGLSYLELLILWLCDYRGDYSNRLREIKRQGEVIKVPWAKS